MSGVSRYLLFPLRIHVLQSERVPELHSTLTDADVTRILEKANRILAQAGIQFYQESLRREPVREAALSEGARHREQADFVLALRPHDSLAPRMFHLYYLRELPINGASLQRDGIFVKDRARLGEVEGGIDEPIPRVTAHELGHQLTLGHVGDATHLMASGTTGVRLSEAEITRARAAARILGWGLSPSAALERAKGAPREERLGILRCLAELPGPSDIRDVAAVRLGRAEEER
jgi:hypothetical protein